MSAADKSEAQETTIDVAGRDTPDGQDGPGDVERWRAISAENLARFWGYAVPAGQRRARWDDAWAADAASPCAYLNSATLRRPVGEDAAGELVGRLRALYAGGDGGPWMLWSAWPTPDLARHGMQLVGHPPLMVRLPGAELPSAPPGLRIAEVTDDDGLRAFEATFIDGYPVPELQPARSRRIFDPRALGGPLRLWVGYADEGGPVAAAGAYVGERAVSIYMVATLPRARGRGYGAALTVRALQAAPGLPAELQASDDGRPVYLRLGFRIVAPYDLWIAPRAAAAPTRMGVG